MNLIMQLLTSVSSSPSTPPPTKSNIIVDILIWVVPISLLVLFGVFQSRQRKKQQQELDKKMSNLKVGDVVKTIGLIYGEIVEYDPDMETYILKTGKEDNPSYIKVDKMAIYQVIPPLAPIDEPVQGVEEIETTSEEVFEGVENQPSEEVINEENKD